MKHPITPPWHTAALSGLLIATTTACQATRPPTHAKSTEALAAVQTRPTQASSSSSAREAITAEYLRTRISGISADEFEGRSPGTRGDLKARTYLREQLAALGVTPGFGGTQWEQPVELVGLKARLPNAWQFRRGERSVSLAFWDQYIAGSGVQTTTGAIEEAEVVFIGYGIEAPEYGWDDFKGQSVKGKVVLVLNDDPDWDPALFAGKTRLYYGRWTYKYENAARHGAVGAIIVHTTPSAGYPYQVVQSSWGGEQFSLPNNGPTSLQIKGWVTEDAARSLVALADQSLERLQTSARSRDFKPIPLGIKTSLRFENQVARVQTANVVGRIDGSDPHLRDEYVVLSAHHDHLGIGKPDATGDAIYNGALDNGAGVAQVLGIVKALQALPTHPRRSILVLFPGAEKLGSSARNISPTTHQLPPARLPPTSTTMAATSGDARETSPRSGKESRRSTPSSPTWQRDFIARCRAISFQTRARSTAPISSTSPRSAYRRCI